jgi:hypothetical protein
MGEAEDKGVAAHCLQWRCGQGSSDNRTTSVQPKGNLEMNLRDKDIHGYSSCLRLKKSS